MSTLQGLPANIYRADYDCTLNAMHGKKRVTITGFTELFEADDTAPAVIIKRRANGYIYAEPVENQGNSYAMGGTYIASSDGRVRDISPYPIPLHDRRMWLENQH